MRIGVDIRPLADRPLSGVGEYTSELLSALLERNDHHDYVFVTNAAGLQPNLPSTWPKERYQLKAHRFPNKLLNASFLIVGRPSIEHLAGPLDCFFSPNLNFFPLPIRVPFVLTVHDLSFLHYAHLLSFRRRLWHRCVRPGRLLREASAVIAVSQATAFDILQHYRLPDHRVHVVHSGIRHRTVLQSYCDTVRSQKNHPDHFLLSLATIEPRKNPLALLAVYKEVRARGWYHGDLVIAGMSGWSLKKFRELLATHPYRDSIHMLGYVTNEEKDALYTAADCLLYLSVFEGFGFPPLEALAHGTPVIAGHHSSLSELCGDSALLVDPYNVRDVAVAIREMLHDEERQWRLRQERSALLDKYSWQRAAEQTVNILTQATNAHRH